MQPSITPSDLLSAAHDSQPRVFVDFQHYVNIYGTDGIYCFVEGYDRQYYSHVIKTISSRPRSFIKCKGKKKVIEIFNFVNPKQAYSGHTLLYFVDRDYDDNSQLSEDICVTEGYSIENYYWGRDVIKEFLLTYCKLNDIDDKEDSPFIKIMNMVDAWTDNFIAVARVFCAFHKLANNRVKESKKWDKRENSIPSDFGQINEHGIVAKEYSFADLNAYFEVSPEVSEEELNEACAEIKGMNDIRGKYVLQLLEAFLKYLKLNSGKGKSLLNKGLSFTIDREKLLSNFATYSYIPNSLRIYVNSKLNPPVDAN